MSEKAVRDALKQLRQTLPTSKPVRLVFTTQGELGECRSTSKAFVIRIRVVACSSCMVEVLYHEYAHARAWAAAQALSTDHDAHWGVEMARIYRVVNGTA